MNNVNTLHTILIDIFRILSFNPKLNFIDNNSIKIETSKSDNLLTLSTNTISVPIPNFYQTFSNRKSKLKDKIVDLKPVQQFVEKLSKENKFIRLNHVGFCYEVDSTEEEVKRIISSVKSNSLHVYEEPSNDRARWLFVGDLTSWSDPLIEFLPIEQSNEPWIEYWLPHVQIDIDTELTANEIQGYIKYFFKNEITPYNIVIDGTTYIVRCRLGSTEGVNINLDLATIKRDVKYHRENVLREI